jgi:hypothetical protein
VVTVALVTAAPVPAVSVPVEWVTALVKASGTAASVQMAQMRVVTRASAAR